MARDITSTVYTFSELSDRAKDTARDWMRQTEAESFASFSADTVLDDCARMAEIIGINLRTRPVKLMGGGTRMQPDVYWAVDCRDAGATFHGNYSYKAGSVAKLAAEAPTEYDGKPQKQNAEVNRIARELAEIQRRNFYQVQASIGHGHGRHTYSTGMDIDVERADDRPISEADVDATVQLLRDFADWVHTQLEAEFEYRMSDEAIDETIEANEYEFTEEGERI